MLLQPPRLDPGYRPAFMARQAYRRTVEAQGQTERLHIALERADGCITRSLLEVLPEECHTRSALGGHLQGCRVGFDLGASDYKLAAVRDGEPVFSREIPWDPVKQTNIAYHLERIESGLHEAASHLPRLDAIGGSAAGIYLHNRVKIASLFRGIPAERFATEVEPLFERIAARFGVPFALANDGDVTALAGAMALGAKGILGIAMGSSEAAGYRDRDGHIGGWLNELAFAPVDFNPNAAASLPALPPT